jgi:hypothetical protein
MTVGEHVVRERTGRFRDHIEPRDPFRREREIERAERLLQLFRASRAQMPFKLRALIDYLREKRGVR